MVNLRTLINPALCMHTANSTSGCMQKGVNPEKAMAIYCFHPASLKWAHRLCLKWVRNQQRPKHPLWQAIRLQQRQHTGWCQNVVDKEWNTSCVSKQKFQRCFDTKHNSMCLETKHVHLHFETHFLCKETKHVMCFMLALWFHPTAAVQKLKPDSAVPAKFK